MHIGEPLRSIIVEPLELPVNDPTTEPVPEPQEPEPTQEPARRCRPSLVVVMNRYSRETSMRWRF